MRKILTAIGLILVGSHSIMAEIPPITKEDKKAFNSCVLLGQCWPDEKPESSFFMHPRVINPLRAILTPTQYQQLLAKQIIQTRPYMQDLDTAETQKHLERTVNMWGFCQSDHAADTKLEACDNILAASFEFSLPWERGMRVRISEERLYDLMVGVDGKGGKIQFILFNKTASLQDGQIRIKPVFYWQDGMDKPADLIKDAVIQGSLAPDCLNIMNQAEKSFEPVLSCLKILGEKFAVPQ